MRQLLFHLGGHLFPNYNMYAKYFDPNNFLVGRNSYHRISTVIIKITDKKIVIWVKIL